MPAATTPRRSMTIVVRTIGDPAAAAQNIVKAISSFDPNLAINRVRTMDSVMSEFLSPYRVEQAAMGVFAAIAVLIATMGLFAIMSHSVASRSRELGVRVALGASGRSLLGLVLGQGLRLAAAGVALGVAAALATMRVLQSRLYQVAPNDPLTLGAVTVGVLVVAMLAGLVPAQRALALDPVSSLKAE
jgi:putative ABC transport system permease protein